MVDSRGPLSSEGRERGSGTHVPRSWIIGMAMFPFGLVAGFTVTALPFLLTHLGVPLYKVATVSSVVMMPTFLGFLLQPLMDTGMTRRAYAWLTAVISAICVAAALLVLSVAHLEITAALLFVGELSIVLYSGAIGGWTAQMKNIERYVAERP